MENRLRNLYLGFVDEVTELADDYFERAFKAGFEEGCKKTDYEWSKERSDAEDEAYCDAFIDIWNGGLRPSGGAS